MPAHNNHPQTLPHLHTTFALPPPSSHTQYNTTTKPRRTTTTTTTPGPGTLFTPSTSPTISPLSSTTTSPTSSPISNPDSISSASDTRGHSPPPPPPFFALPHRVHYHYSGGGNGHHNPTQKPPVQQGQHQPPKYQHLQPQDKYQRPPQADLTTPPLSPHLVPVNNNNNNNNNNNHPARSFSSPAVLKQTEKEQQGQAQALSFLPPLEFGESPLLELSLSSLLPLSPELSPEPEQQPEQQPDPERGSSLDFTPTGLGFVASEQRYHRHHHHHHQPRLLSKIEKEVLEEQGRAAAGAVERVGLGLLEPRPFLWCARVDGGGDDRMIGRGGVFLEGIEEVLAG
ncbi:uncharacterized protein BP01DRAFT_366538 [Aspergillus saccharolyticus JOP 1030-1]|uniref:Uncharacterized protein n=1 Tax=Aspergillus saccharolyticus JOP 1030-1 TaxID=1450539 RepID=A0A319ABW2_9EURO|nr:hypothetical protein BP01DRAFT_366538 [Aspergillus saccharolyticus JOP 1030-1]PYH44402.1 hypothetical protein BP01DRAFT_366538 [Aspergillus saccharolyticus JOP 1030-1]